MKYNSTEQQIIKSFKSELDNQNIRWVIPRGYQNLPSSVPGGDIDIYVAADDFQAAVTIAKDCGFGPKDRPTGSQRIASKVKSGPMSTLIDGVKRPKKAVSFLYRSYKNPVFEDLSVDRYSEWKGYNDDVMVHLMNHVAYESPWNSSMIRVDPEVEQSLFDGSRRLNGYPVPDQPDELAHLICRGLFSHEGDFRDYYLNWCNSLSEDVQSSSSKSKKFDWLLGKLFFDADVVVREAVNNNEYDSLRDDLIAFSQY